MDAAAAFAISRTAQNGTRTGNSGINCGCSCRSLEFGWQLLFPRRGVPDAPGARAEWGPRHIDEASAVGAEGETAPLERALAGGLKNQKLTAAGDVPELDLSGSIDLTRYG